MLKVGTGLLYPIDDYNQIGIYVDLSKYLVPTEPIQEGTTPEDEAAYKEKHDEYNNMSPITVSSNHSVTRRMASRAS